MMKIRTSISSVFALLAGAMFPTMAAAQETPGWMGTFGGSYVCSDGEHGFYLNIEEATETDNGHTVSGTLGFFPVLSGADGSAATVAGSFQVSGTFEYNGDIHLEPGEWLVPTENYGAAMLDGNFSWRTDGRWQIEGRPVVPGNEDNCSALIATQFLP